MPPETLEQTSWNDPRAVQLRRAMDDELGARYAGLFTEAIAKALTVDPATIAATVLALEHGLPVGHAALRRLGEEWEVKRLVVLRSHRGRGLARRLMAEVERIAVEAGRPRLILQTGDRQPEAVSLYESLGYTRIPIFEPYVDALPMSHCFEKPLTPT